MLAGKYSGGVSCRRFDLKDIGRATRHGDGRAKRTAQRAGPATKQGARKTATTVALNSKFKAKTTEQNARDHDQLVPCTDLDAGAALQHGATDLDSGSPVRWVEAGTQAAVVDDQTFP